MEDKRGELEDLDAKSRPAASQLDQTRDKKKVREGDVVVCSQSKVALAGNELPKMTLKLEAWEGPEANAKERIDAAKYFEVMQSFLRTTRFHGSAYYVDLAIRVSEQAQGYELTSSGHAFVYLNHTFSESVTSPLAAIILVTSAAN